MSARPKSITGGCLCGSIRYEITVPEEASWPADCCTCQCNICRKFSGSLVAYELLIKPNQFSDITNAPTYKEYRSSEAATRSFCSNCGSGLTAKLDFVPDIFVVFMGTVDQDQLMGKKVDGSEEETEMGQKFKREGGLFKELTSFNMGHLYWNNIIPGVTDNFAGDGPKFMQSFPEE